MVEHFWRSCVLCEEALYYRPQTKFAKVMFLHLSVSHSVHGGGVCMGGSGGLGSLPPLDTTGYGQRAGGTHPTEMHSLLLFSLPVHEVVGR